MKNFQRLQVAVAALGVLSLLALSSAFGRGMTPLSPIPVALTAGVLACLSQNPNCSLHIHCQHLPSGQAHEHAVTPYWRRPLHLDVTTAPLILFQRL